MKRLHRWWHALFGHKDVYVDLTKEPWSAICTCGFSLHVRQFTMGYSQGFSKG
jgi:hypothetical protein